MTEGMTKNSPAYRKAILALFLGSIIAFGAEYCVQPIIPVLAESFGLAPAEASLAVSSGTAGMAVSMVLLAFFSKRMPRKKTMAAAVIGASLLMVAMAFTSSFYCILLFRFLQGILLAGFPVMAIAYVNEEFSSSIVGAVIGIYVAGTSIGGLLGRIVLSSLTDSFSWQHSLLFMSGLYLVTGACFLLWLPAEKAAIASKTGKESQTSAASLWRLLTNFRLVLVYLIAFALLGAFVCTYNFISYVFLAPPYQLSQTVIGFIFLTYLVGTAASAYMGKLSDRIGSGRVLMIGIFCMGVGTLISLAMPLLFKIAGLAVFTYGFFGAHTAACGWAGRLGNGNKAQISALYMLFYYSGASVVGTAGGYFLKNYGWDGIVFFLLVVLGLAFFLSLLLMEGERATEKQLFRQKL